MRIKPNLTLTKNRKLLTIAALNQNKNSIQSSNNLNDKSIVCQTTSASKNSTNIKLNKKNNAKTKKQIKKRTNSLLNLFESSCATTNQTSSQTLNQTKQTSNDSQITNLSNLNLNSNSNQTNKQKSPSLSPKIVGYKLNGSFATCLSGKQTMQNNKSSCLSENEIIIDTTTSSDFISDITVKSLDDCKGKF